MPNPDLEISLLKPEEAGQYMRIRHQVFKGTVNNIIYSRTRGKASQKTLDRVTADIREGMAKGVLFLKCVDKTTGQMIAGARWRYVKPKEEGTKERTWEEVEAAFAIPLPTFDETEPEMIDALMKLFNGGKRDFLGTRPYYCLDTLVTLPEHERRGAGSMLVKWGCDRADEAGVCAYLEASPVGRPMYARHGFEVQTELELDLRRWGGDTVMQFYPMLRPAKPLTG